MKERASSNSDESTRDIFASGVEAISNFQKQSQLRE